MKICKCGKENKTDRWVCASCLSMYNYQNLLKRRKAAGGKMGKKVKKCKGCGNLILLTCKCGKVK